MSEHPHDLARHPVLLLGGVGLLALAIFVLLAEVVPDAAAFAVAIPLATIAAVIAVVELGGVRHDGGSRDEHHDGPAAPS